MNLGIGNIYQPFRGRRINPAKPVRLHRNLHGGTELKYSVMQGGLVVGHTNQMMLKDCVCIINPKIQAKVRKEKRKQVHAFIRGTVQLHGGFGTTAADSNAFPAKITYNPYSFDTFVCTNLTTAPFPVEGAAAMIFRPEGVSAVHTY